MFVIFIFKVHWYPPCGMYFDKENFEGENFVGNSQQILQNLLPLKVTVYIDS